MKIQKLVPVNIQQKMVVLTKKEIVESKYHAMDTHTQHFVNTIDLMCQFRSTTRPCTRHTLISFN